MWDDADEANRLLARVAAHVPERLGHGRRARRRRAEPLHLVFDLNDDFEGGATDFPELHQVITPRTGRALLFQHRILHEATEVRRGEKLVLRTDLLYR